MQSTDDRDPSRRDFLALSVAGFLQFASRRMRHAGRDDMPLIYVGTYTEGHPQEGIYLVRFDPLTGALRQVGSADAGENPSFLALHPNGRVLYAVNETASGSVTGFAIARETGALTRINQEKSGGDAPCYVSVHPSGRAVLVANYDSGTVALLTVDADGVLSPASCVDAHSGSGPRPEQKSAHAHCIITDPSRRFALAADLGADRVFVYRLNLDGGSLVHVPAGDATMSPGAGPRHLVFHPSLPLLYVASELDSTLTTLRFDSEHGALTHVDTRPTLLSDWSRPNAVADVHVTSNGRNVYVSNRGHNSIAVFSVAPSGTPTLVQDVSCGGDWPRNFALDPSERWLLVANQRSNSVVVFSRDETSGRLTPTAQTLVLPSPVCLRFLA
jgi:6-phosphogluconolactonase